MVIAQASYSFVLTFKFLYFIAICCEKVSQLLVNLSYVAKNRQAKCHKNEKSTQATKSVSLVLQQTDSNMQVHDCRLLMAWDTSKSI